MKSRSSFLNDKRSLIEKLRSLDRGIIENVDRLKKIKDSIEYTEWELASLEKQEKEWAEQQKNELKERLSELKEQKKEIINQLKRARNEMDSLLSEAKILMDNYYREAKKGKSNIEHFRASGFRWEHRATEKEWQEYGNFFYELLEEIDTTVRSLEFAFSLKEVEEDIQESDGLIALLGGIFGFTAGGCLGGFTGALIGGIAGAAIGGILDSVTKDSSNKKRELSGYFSTGEAGVSIDLTVEDISRGSSPIVGIGLNKHLIPSVINASDIGLKDTSFLRRNRYSQHLSFQSQYTPSQNIFVNSSVDIGPTSTDSKVWVPYKVSSVPSSISRESEAQYRPWVTSLPMWENGSILAGSCPSYPSSVTAGSVERARFAPLDNIYSSSVGNTSMNRFGTMDAIYSGSFSGLV